MIAGVPATRPGASVEAPVVTYDAGAIVRRDDRLATEEPLEIRLRAGDERRTIAITMRTPGHDFELAAGFLYAEGILSSRDALRGMSYCLAGDVGADQQYNVVNVDLAARALPPLDALERHFTTTSACGVCGKANLEALAARGLRPVASDARFEARTIVGLPETLRRAQNVFAKTGGLHAAGLFTATGDLLALREDVGRHNALDKLVGWAFVNGRLPLRDRVLLVSGRASYELVQKAVAAEIPLVCAVSAPSSLAVDTARAYGVTLVGFLRGERFNAYAHDGRIVAGAT